MHIQALFRLCVCIGIHMHLQAIIGCYISVCIGINMHLQAIIGYLCV